MGQVAALVSAHLRTEFFRSLLDQEMSYFDSTSSGVLNASVDSQTKKIETGMGSQLALTVANFSQFLTCFVISFTSSWQFSLVMLAWTPILVIAGVIQGKL